MQERLERYDAHDFVGLAKDLFYSKIHLAIMGVEHNFREENGDWTVRNIQETKNTILQIVKESKEFDFDAPDGYLYTYDFKDLAEEQLADNFGDAFWCLIEGEK